MLEFCKISKKLIIYGAGGGGANVERFLRQNAMLIDSFCVTRLDDKETYISYPIKEIAEVRQDTEGIGVIVAVSKKFVEEILENLNEIRYFYATNA